MNNKGIWTIFICAVSLGSAVAHDIVVHENITLNAVASIVADPASGYNNFLGTISNDCTAFSALNLLRVGSAFEDNLDQAGDVGGKRSLNHFYDPISGGGLSDALPLGVVDYFGFAPALGQASFVWASTSNCAGVNIVGVNNNKSNIWSWPNARGYEYLGLTSSSPSVRAANLGLMFRALGQVVHLLEDASQPEHVRNENHLDYWPIVSSVFDLSFETPIHSRFEDYGAANWKTLNYSNNVLDWRGLGFTKMEDFWDRHLYHGYFGALNDDANGVEDSQLGLAEFANGNFIGERHSYAEYFYTNSIGYYPFPSRNLCTDYPLKRQYLASGIGNYKLHNGYTAQGIYLRKNNGGVPVAYHSRFLYEGVRHPEKQTPQCTTIRDDTVLSNYLSILIPKAVEYSAGLLDYYFRGTLAVAQSGSSGGMVSIQIQNTSGMDFTNGAFQLFYDDSSGNRMPITDFSLTASGFAADSLLYGSFTPNTSATDYVLVYQGSIGVTNGVALDVVDSDIAIAATIFTADISSLPLPMIDFDNVVWDNPVDSVFGVGYSFSGKVFSAGASGSEGWELSNTGYLTYTGPGGTGDLHVVINSMTGDPGVVIDIFDSAGNLNFGAAFGEHGPGTYDVYFTVPASTADNYTITVNCDNLEGSFQSMDFTATLRP